MSGPRYSEKARDPEDAISPMPGDRAVPAPFFSSSWPSLRGWRGPRALPSQPRASADGLGRSGFSAPRRRSLIGGLTLAPLLVVLDDAPARGGAEALFGFDFSNVDALLFYNRESGIRILDDRGRFVGARGAYYGPPLPYEKIPKHVILLLVTQEDRKFLSDSVFRSWGFDWGGIARAVAVNIAKGRIAQGGSTLTQQVLKEIFLRKHGRVERKLEELVLTPSLDASLNKGQILFLYLNRVYFGAGAYGIEAAAKVIFDKPAQNLTLFEAAALIQALNSPSKRNLLFHPEIAVKRARELIEQAVKEEFISPQAAAVGLKQPLRVASPRRVRNGGFYPDHPCHGWYIAQAEKESGDFTIPQEGVRTIETLLDRDLQIAAHEALTRTLARHGARLNIEQGALVAMRPNGRIVALVGGADHATSEWNNATQARRQPGSAFKLFVYLAALERGMRPTDLVSDAAPVKLTADKIVSNYDFTYRGQITLAEALACSSNVAAIELIRGHVGQVIDIAKRLGITAKLEEIEGLALGVREVTLLELVRAYAAIANNGILPGSYCVARLKDDAGNHAAYPDADRARRVLTPEIAAMMRDMLTGVFGRKGTAARANPGIWAAGKSGTTDDYRDAWFIGFTRGLVVGVWLGNERQRPMNGVTGGGLPAQIWRELVLFDAKRRKASA
jgi:penicillin-binding protein 1A